MPRYRTKPIYVQAFRMTEDARSDPTSWPDWMTAAGDNDQQLVRGAEGTDDLSVGDGEVCHDGDWILKLEDSGELHVVADETFREKFEMVKDAVDEVVLEVEASAPNQQPRTGNELHPKHVSSVPVWPQRDDIAAGQGTE